MACSTPRRAYERANFAAYGLKKMNKGRKGENKAQSLTARSSHEFRCGKVNAAEPASEARLVESSLV